MLLRKEIDKLKTQLFGLSAVVEDSVSKAVLAVERQDPRVAEDVRDADHKIDEMEVEIEEECLKILALHQPVANDLRLIISVLKMNNDLERIGDLAVNIAKRVKHLEKYPEVELPHMKEMTEKVRSMLRKSLDSLVNQDSQLAREVLSLDDDVDAINRRHFRYAEEAMREQPDQIPGFLGAVTVSRNLERVADLATNIAEDVVYLVDGDIVRHHLDATHYTSDEKDE